VFGAKGTAMADNNTPTSMVVLNESGTIRDKPLYFFLERYKNAFVAEMQAFVDAIREDKPTLVSGKDGLVPVLIALAAQESLKTGKPVQVVSV
jgi:myo-inositol 2-dehydrogenase/D-chiro-inositol 1-dehydrogenase